MHAVPIAPLAAHPLLIFLLQVGALLLTALLLGRLASRLGMTPVVGELAAGVILGPSLLGQVAPGLSNWLFPHRPEQTHLLDAAGQIGVLLLVGLTGTEIDFALVKKRGATGLRVSLAGLFIPLSLGVATALSLPASLHSGHGGSVVFALFLGVAMCVSAIPVIAKTLMDMNLIHRNIGQLTLTAGAVDDVVGWLLLSIVSALAASRATVTAATTAVLTLLVVGVFALGPGRWIVRAALRNERRPQAQTGPTVTTVAILILLAAAATQSMGLEAVFGAFVCGIVIGSSRAVPLERLAPLRTVVLSVLAPVFFATAGLRVTLRALGKPTILISAVTILLIAIVGKFAGAYLGARLSRLSRWEALALGAGMNARGVIQVIVATVGLRLGVLSPDTYTIVVLVAIVTSVMASPILRAAMRHVEYTAEEELRLTDRLGTPVPGSTLPHGGPDQTR